MPIEMQHAGIATWAPTLRLSYGCIPGRPEGPVSARGPVVWKLLRKAGNRQGNGKKNKGPWGSDSALASLRVVWLRGRARHLKIDMKVPISLAKSCRPISPSPTPSYRNLLESLVLPTVRV